MIRDFGVHVPTTRIALVDGDTRFLAAAVEIASVQAGAIGAGDATFEVGRPPGEPDVFQPAQPPSQVSFCVGMTLEEVERQMLFKTMAYFNNHKPKAAEALGISLKTVYNRLARFGYASHPAESRPLESGVASG